jgi:hypothetical protein
MKRDDLFPRRIAANEWWFRWEGVPHIVTGLSDGRWYLDGVECPQQTLPGVWDVALSGAQIAAWYVLATGGGQEGAK